NHIESLTVVTPDGELRRINRLAQSALFSLVVGGQGLFGAIYSVTLRVGSLLRSADETIRATPVAPGAPDGRALQLLLPSQAADGFIADARAGCAEWRVDVASVEVRPIVPETESFLCWARSECVEVSLRLAEALALGPAVRRTQLRRELIDAAIAAGGSFQISCTPDATREQVAACYPQLPAFLAEKRRVDPAEKLVNGWYLHHRNLFSRERCETRWNQA